METPDIQFINGEKSSDEFKAAVYLLILCVLRVFDDEEGFSGSINELAISCEIYKAIEESILAHNPSTGIDTRIVNAQILQPLVDRFNTPSLAGMYGLVDRFVRVKTTSELQVFVDGIEFLMKDDGIRSFIEENYSLISIYAKSQYEQTPFGPS